MRIRRWLFWSLIPVSVWSTRDPRRAALGRRLMRSLGTLTLWVRRARRQSSLDGIGREWQRMFPDPAEHPITQVENGTVRAEIRTRCPYRGTGNVEGCYRMMEYDRRMMEKIGAQFVVLRSQAEPGVTECQVALRPLGIQIQNGRIAADLATGQTGHPRIYAAGDCVGGGDAATVVQVVEAAKQAAYAMHAAVPAGARAVTR